MAALRLGVGDVFTVCKSVVDLCAKVTTTNHEEMKDVRLLVAEMEMMREHLSAVQQNLSHNETGKGGVEKDVAPLMTRSLVPIHNDLLALRQTLQQHHHRKQSCHVLDQARYMLHYHDQLSAFKQSMPRHRESICVMRDIVEDNASENPSITEGVESWGDVNVQVRTRRDSIMKLAGIVEREEAKEEDDAYHQGWLDESSRLRQSVETAIMEEDEPENDYTLSSSSSSPPIRNSTQPSSKPLSYTPFSTFPKPALFSSKPAFKLDIFESFSCTNTPRSSPPLETAYLEP